MSNIKAQSKGKLTYSWETKYVFKLSCKGWAGVSHTKWARNSVPGTELEESLQKIPFLSIPQEDVCH